MMATATQYNPNHDLNAQLLAAGLSKTVYALVTPETEEAKYWALGLGDCCEKIHAEYFDMFREAWTGKQDTSHEEFFDEWHRWSEPMVALDRENLPFYYPCNGASEPIRHLIYQLAAKSLSSAIHFFEGEYEGYRAMAEAAGLSVIVHTRDEWQIAVRRCVKDDLFFISAPSAIDGNVWSDLNAFLAIMPTMSVVVDATYVGAVPSSAVKERFDLNADSVHSVIFSLSKPFGVYYDRIGGIFTREEDLGLFGNRWFKNLTSLRLGTALLKKHAVFELAAKYGERQRQAIANAERATGLSLTPSDVFILATGEPRGTELAAYVERAGKLRVCLTPGMAETLKAEGAYHVVGNGVERLQLL